MFTTMEHARESYAKTLTPCAAFIFNLWWRGHLPLTREEWEETPKEAYSAIMDAISNGLG